MLYGLLVGVIIVQYFWYRAKREKTKHYRSSLEQAIDEIHGYRKLLHWYTLVITYLLKERSGLLTRASKESFKKNLDQILISQMLSFYPRSRIKYIRDLFIKLSIEIDKDLK